MKLLMFMKLLMTCLWLTTAVQLMFQVDIYSVIKNKDEYEIYAVTLYVQ